jgi:hypothetical protein
VGTRIHRYPEHPLSVRLLLARESASRRPMTGRLGTMSGLRARSHLPISYCHLNALLRGLHTSHPSRSLSHRYGGMIELARRRIHTDNGKSAPRVVRESEHEDHALSNSSHSHTHGLFGGRPHSHSHSHGHDHDHDHGGELIETLQSGGARRPSPLSPNLFTIFSAPLSLIHLCR